MAIGAVKWFTRGRAPSSVEGDSKRRLVRAALRARRQVELGDQVGHASFRRANRRPRFHCAACGYGIVAAGTLPPCPMCRGNDWIPSKSR